MKTLNITAAGALALLLAACGGGSAPSAGPLPTAAPPTAQGKTVQTQFTISVPTSTASVAAKKPDYVGAGVRSITIALNAVNGATPPAGLTTSVTTNITLPCAPCTVPGPSVPPGTDDFTLTTYDGLAGAGSAISTSSPSLTIAAGSANSNTITLDGIPNTFTIAGLPTATAGTAFGAPAAFSVTVKDADGNTITGNYASPVTIADSDTSSLTQGTALAVNGGTAATSIQSTNSSDTFTINYGGLAIAPATLTASAAGATNGTATFTPALQPIVWTCTQAGGCSTTANQIDLYATSGTGSSFTSTASEVGWTNAPYNKTITATAAAGCSSIAATTPGSGTSLTTTVAASPAAGTCVLTLSDFTGGQTQPITLTYTTSGIGVN